MMAWKNRGKKVVDDSHSLSKFSTPVQLIILPTLAGTQLKRMQSNTNDTAEDSSALFSLK